MPVGMSKRCRDCSVELQAFLKTGRLMLYCASRNAVMIDKIYTEAVGYRWKQIWIDFEVNRWSFEAVWINLKQGWIEFEPAWIDFGRVWIDFEAVWIDLRWVRNELEPAWEGFVLAVMKGLVAAVVADTIFCAGLSFSWAETLRSHRTAYISTWASKL